MSAVSASVGDLAGIGADAGSVPRSGSEAHATPATIHSLEPADAQQQRLLERLRQSDGQPVAFAALHAGGIDFPASVVCELELSGYGIERVRDQGRLVGVRLLRPEPRDEPAVRTSRPQRRSWRWPASRRH